MKIEYSNENPEAEIPFWILCQGAECSKSVVLMQNVNEPNRSPIPVPFASLATANSSDRYGAEIIIPHEGEYRFSVGGEQKTLTIRPHYTLSFGEEFVWVFSAIITVIAAIVIYMSKKNKNKMRVNAT